MKQDENSAVAKIAKGTIVANAKPIIAKLPAAQRLRKFQRISRSVASPKRFHNSRLSLAREPFQFLQRNVRKTDCHNASS